MTLTIKSVRTSTDEEWDHIWSNCDYATYFHSREWAEIWHRHTHNRMRPEPKIIEFSDGSNVLFPFSSQRIMRGLVKNYISSPAGTFGGWLSNDILNEEHAIILHKYIITTYRNLTLVLNPYDKLIHKMNIDVSVENNTRALNLECGFDEIYKGWTKGHASAARKARKAGIIIREATSLENWESYYCIYEESLKRWGDSASSQYEWKLFEIMYRLSSSNIKLWLAILENNIVAGALCFYAKRHVVYWHGSALSEYFNMRPVNLLMYEIIKDASENAYEWFDFNPSGGHEGVENFKKSFGAKALECQVINRESRIVKLLRTIR